MLKTVGNPSTRYGDQTIVDGNLVVAMAGKGIDFSATGQAAGMTSEVLSDYEEGTWTPTFTAEVVGNLTVAYSTQLGHYTKVGRLVTVNFSIQTSTFTHSTASGTARIGGLPFTCSATAGTQHFGAIGLQGLQKTNYTQVVCASAGNTQNLIFVVSGPATNQNYANVNITEFPSGGSVTIRGSISYMV